MSNIMSLVYSFILIFPTILLGVDFFIIGKIIVELETRATIVSYIISEEGGIRPSLVNELAEEGITITCEGEYSYISVGETIKYQLIKTYTPIIIKNEDINIYVTRTTIVGYL